MGKKFTEKLIKEIDNGADEDVLNAFCEFFRRVEITTDLIQDQESGLVTHQIMIIKCGDKAVASAPLAYEWPLKPANLPEEAKGDSVAIN